MGQTFQSKCYKTYFHAYQIQTLSQNTIISTSLPDETLTATYLKSVIRKLIWPAFLKAYFPFLSRTYDLPSHDPYINGFPCQG